MADPLQIEVAEQEDRFARFKLIAWWDQDLLARTKVLLIGAGALGNELLKNLALLGVGRVLVADMDSIEKSNLSRSVLFRLEDEGQPKALVASRSAAGIFPDMKVEAFSGNITTQLGLGAFRWADVVLGGLDNREARLFTNRSSLKLGTPWVDGAIEALQGVARAFLPGEGACYECTLGENDWKILAARKACTLLTREEMEAGRVPTTPTTSSVVAGIQCQEALKILHELDGVLDGGAYVFDGLYHNSYRVDYTRDPDCHSHDSLDLILETGRSGEDTTFSELLDLGAQTLAEEYGHTPPADELVLDLGRDVIDALECEGCDSREVVFAPLGSMSEEQARCAACGEVRSPHLLNQIPAGDPLLERTPAEVGLPPWDIVVARWDERRVGLELDGDRDMVLGSLDEEAA